MKYRLLTKKEEEKAIIQIIETLLDSSVPYSGKHRKAQWEKGWSENLKSGNITPKYFGKYPILRINGNLVKSPTPTEEPRLLHELVSRVTGQYFTGVKDVYEFGCGTGHNLPFITYGKYKTLHGLDWAKSSQKILKKAGIDAHNFDFFKPSKLKLAKDSGVITVAALEQTGTNYKKFVAYLLKNKPKYVIHIEPIPELLNPNNLLDYLSIKYMQKRKYLSGYLDYLLELQSKGKLKVIEAQRSGVGSLFIDGYSILVWKPL